LSRDSLAAYGIFLGQVTWQEKIVNGVISSRVLARLGHDLHAEELDQVSPSLWRTLVADRDPDGRNPPAWYHRACLMCLAADVKLGKLDTKEIIARDGNSMKARYLRRVQDVCWGRTYFECQMGSDESGGQKLHGIGPADVQKNDTVCVLFGCSTPVVLRPMWTGEGDYTVVGPAFVLGMMDGEALENLKPDERKFTLY
jgi:hypothetical protein